MNACYQAGNILSPCKPKPWNPQAHATSLPLPVCCVVRLCWAGWRPNHAELKVYVYDLPTSVVQDRKSVV